MTDPRRARTFDDVSELYDTARPTYPDLLFDDLVELAGLQESDRVLEVGCGTGQATRPLAARGVHITCVEVGERLAAVARRKLAGVANVEVVTAAFETWQPLAAEFAAVVAFTSFHWIDPGVRYTRASTLLRDRGVLGVVSTHHVLPPDGDPFFRDVQRDYEAVVPADPATVAGGPVEPALVEDLSDEIAASGLFDVLASRRYRWDVIYGEDEYIRLLETYSNHRAFPDDVRHELFQRIRGRIRGQPGKHVRKSYLAILDLARARPATR